MSKIAVVAIGGNSLIKDKDRQTVPDQFGASRETCSHIAKMIVNGWNIVLTHGNGPQVGFILRRSELAAHELHTVPLDSCGADTQGAIGYMLQQGLYNEFKKIGMNKRSVTVVTQVLVERDDPSFELPIKPIGSFMDEGTALKHRDSEGWAVKEDTGGRGWRRVVPSPIPKKIIEYDAISNLINSGYVVIAVGGGGIPVVDDEGELKGVEAVIDKDLASSLLARELKADLFLISTDVEKVYLNYKKENQSPIDRMTLTEAKKHYEDGQFPAGSMGPKIKAAIEFIGSGGGKVIITMPENIESALRGETGTWIVKEIL